MPQKNRYSYILVLVGVLSIFWLVVSRSLLVLANNVLQNYEQFFSQSLPIRLAIAFLVLGSMALLSVLWYTLQDQQEYNNRRNETERLAKEAELNTLRQQLQPHFLFNSLNSINALIGLKPAEARTMIQQLSDFLRGTLKKEATALESLQEELNHLALYLQIEKVRFGYRLTTEIVNELEAKDYRLPSMLLQPIVENAIKFGLYDTIGSVTITIKTSLIDNDLVISVQNPFDPATSLPSNGTGFGLSSVQRRLFLIYNRGDLLQTTRLQNSFTTTVKIPQLHDQGNNN
ncbi:MAG TPA: histidine kinase [Chitinophagaceae bacterium]|nr:histidine kinase [Chitinophagaceae bacterium]